MAFHVGQKVECVDDSNANLINCYPILMIAPKKGERYTISAVGLIHSYDPQQLPCVHVSELDRPFHSPIWAHRFRAIVEQKTDISIFTAMLNPKDKIRKGNIKRELERIER